MFNHSYPYTDNHELNLDWILERIKVNTSEWNTFRDALNVSWEEYKAGLNHEWETVEAAWQTMKTFVETFFENLDVQEEVNTKINELVNDGTILNLIKTYIGPFNFKGAVQTINDLPDTGTLNDTYYIEELKYRVTWTGEAWEQSSLDEADYLDELSNLNNKIDNLLTIDYADILKNKPIREHWYINKNSGIASAGYFSIEHIPIDGNKKYIAYSESQTSIRLIDFYNDENYLYSLEAQSEFTAPANANNLSVSILYVDRTTENHGEFYIKELGSIDTYNTHGTKLKSSDILNVTEANSNFHARRPIISFILDGIYDWNKDMSDIIKSHGYRCGNAPQYTNINDGDNLSILKSLQSEGHEILSHLTYILNDSSPYTEEEGAEIIKNSYTTLINNGFNVHGCIGSSGAVSEKYLKYIKRYYAYAATVNNRSGSELPYLLFNTSSPYKLWRYSMQISTLTQMKNAVDLAINNGGLLLFYGHAKSTNTDNFTKENLEELLTYVDNKVNNSLCTVKTPYEALNDYYTIRYEDVISA